MRVTYWNDEYGCWAYHCSSGDAAKLLHAYEDAMSVERAQELAQAERDGRLVVLPCKITDTVYLIESILKGKKVIGEQVISALIDHVTIGGTAGKPVFDICSATDNWYMALEPGEFFLTREEAESALNNRERREI